MQYTLGKDMIFVILALISSLAMLSQHAMTATIFFGLAILFIVFEHQIFDYLGS